MQVQIMTYPLKKCSIEDVSRFTDENESQHASPLEFDMMEILIYQLQNLSSLSSRLDF